MNRHKTVSNLAIRASYSPILVIEGNTVPEFILQKNLNVTEPIISPTHQPKTLYLLHLVAC